MYIVNFIFKHVSKKNKKRISLVERVINLSLIGKMLGLIIHNHLNSRIHLCWSTETGTLNYRDSIERMFLQEKEWLFLCKALKISGVDGARSVPGSWNNIRRRSQSRTMYLLKKAMWGKRSVWIKCCRKYL